MASSSQRLLAGAVLVGTFLTGNIVNAQINDDNAPSAADLRVVSKVSTVDPYVQTVHEKFKWVSQSTEEIAQARIEKEELVKEQIAVAKAAAAKAAAEKAAAEKVAAEKAAAAKVAAARAAQQRQIAQAESSSATVSRGESESNSIIQKALSLQGIPYVFGGISLKGFDCSGFTKYVYSGTGISLARSSFAQFASGAAVSRSQLQPGDLVFFSTYAGGASHVGIYIGGGQFVHASNSGVRTTSLYDSYYAARYMGARRY